MIFPRDCEAHSKKSFFQKDTNMLHICDYTGGVLYENGSVPCGSGNGEISSACKLRVENCSDSAIYIGFAVNEVVIINTLNCRIVVMLSVGVVEIVSSDGITVSVVCPKVRLIRSTNCFVNAFVWNPTELDDTGGDVVLGPFNVCWHNHEVLLGKILDDDALGSHHAFTWSDYTTISLGRECAIRLLDSSDYRIVHFPDFGPYVESLVIPIPLPDRYFSAFSAKIQRLRTLRDRITTASTAASAQKINAVLRGHFRDWLTSTNRIQQTLDIALHNRQT